MQTYTGVNVCVSYMLFLWIQELHNQCRQTKKLDQDRESACYEYVIHNGACIPECPSGYTTINSTTYVWLSLTHTYTHSPLMPPQTLLCYWWRSSLHDRRCDHNPQQIVPLWSLLWSLNTLDNICTQEMMVLEVDQTKGKKVFFFHCGKSSVLCGKAAGLLGTHDVQ